jgi:hypothetical protein
MENPFISSSFFIEDLLQHLFILLLTTEAALCCERACSLVVTRAPVAPKVLGSTPRVSEFLRI